MPSHQEMEKLGDLWPGQPVGSELQGPASPHPLTGLGQLCGLTGDARTLGSNSSSLPWEKGAWTWRVWLDMSIIRAFPGPGPAVRGSCWPARCVPEHMVVFGTCP